MATQLAALAEEMRRHWSGAGLSLAAIDEDEILATERRLGTALPTEYRSFLKLAGIPSDQDTLGFHFWQPNAFQLTTEVVPSSEQDLGQGRTSVVFADYLDESWWYVIWTAGDHSGMISRALGTEHGPDPEDPLGTLETFCRAYLSDDKVLYGA